MRNRGFNAAQNGLSVQPVFGGPAYFYRNIVYDVAMGHAIKLGGANPAGIVFYHNTFVAEAGDGGGSSSSDFRNNPILGTNRPKPVLRHQAYTSYSILDHNGYRPNPADEPAFQWRAPAPGVLRAYDLDSSPWQRFASLAGFARATSRERHGVLVDYDVFRRVQPPDAARPHAVYSPEGLDFRLRPGGAAVDAGVRLPNVNDGFSGRAPDLGALELGAAVPIYGPRPR